jgi:futalosine hydrolase
MRLLLVAATEQEIAPLLKEMKFCGDINPQLRWYQYKDVDIEVLVTGVGMVAMAAWVSRVLSQRNYISAINVGICGSFDRSIALGEVVRVHTDCLPELGVEDDSKFVDIYDLNLSGKHDFPFRNGLLTGNNPAGFSSLMQLRAVNGITVNKVHGNESSIAEVIARVNAQVESMEGAAFFYACSIADVFALQIRAVSNYVEKRNRAAWRIEEAVKNLSAELLKYIDRG